MPYPKSVFITGCSRGIGLGLVRHILNQQQSSLTTIPEHLIASCRDPSTAEELQNLAKRHPTLKIIPLDVTKDDQIKAAFERTKAIVGESGLNLLINNAGVYVDKADGGSLEKMTREKLQDTFNVNATTPTLVTQTFLPLLKTAADHHRKEPMSCRRAAVINVSSVKGSIHNTLTQSKQDGYHYRSSKAALNMLTALMSVELHHFGIVVSAVHPGCVQTDMGGTLAALSVGTSAESIWSVVTGLDGESTGRLFSYDGSLIPW